jgi:hypothetical protein
MTWRTVRHCQGETRHGVDACRGLPRQIAGAKPQQGRAQLLALRQVIPPAVALKFWQPRGIGGIASIHKPLTEPAPKSRYRRQVEKRFCVCVRTRSKSVMGHKLTSRHR